VDQHLKGLFEQEMAAEPPYPPRDVAGDAVRRGTRLRRRSRMTVAGAAAGVTLVLVAAAWAGPAAWGGGGAPSSVGAPTAYSADCIVPSDEPWSSIMIVLESNIVTPQQRTSLEDLLRENPIVLDVTYSPRFDSAGQNGRLGILSVQLRVPMEAGGENLAGLIGKRPDVARVFGVQDHSMFDKHGRTIVPTFHDMDPVPGESGESGEPLGTLSPGEVSDDMKYATPSPGSSPNPPSPPDGLVCPTRTPPGQGR
jgi:hypothetical protein